MRFFHLTPLSDKGFAGLIRVIISGVASLFHPPATRISLGQLKCTEIRQHAR